MRRLLLRADAGRVTNNQSAAPPTADERCVAGPWPNARQSDAQARCGANGVATALISSWQAIEDAGAAPPASPRTRPGKSTSPDCGATIGAAGQRQARAASSDAANIRISTRSRRVVAGCGLASPVDRREPAPGRRYPGRNRETPARRAPTVPCPATTTDAAPARVTGPRAARRSGGQPAPDRNSPTRHPAIRRTRQCDAAHPANGSGESGRDS